MSMMLTVAQPAKADFGARFYHGHRLPSHEVPPRVPVYKSRYSPLPRTQRVDSPVSSLRVSEPPSLSSSVSSTTSHSSASPLPVRTRTMHAPNRGVASLPPPSAMGLPDPRSNPTSLLSYSSQSAGQPYTQPPQHRDHLEQQHRDHLEQQHRDHLEQQQRHQELQQHEESTRNWYQYKAEEERRKQEEERTRQETLKLEQRKIEASMLHDALHGGIPPTMVPMIYAGLGSQGGNTNQEWVQQLIGQFQTLAAQQQHLQQRTSPPEPRRDPRPASYGYQVGSHSTLYQPQVVPSQHSDVVQPVQSGFSAFNSQSAVPRSAAHAALPRLTTSDVYPPSTQPKGTGSAHPTHTHDQPSSPNIFFHHWVPPSETKSSGKEHNGSHARHADRDREGREKGHARHQSNLSNRPHTPTRRSLDEPPSSAHPSHVSESSFRDSPRKRKAGGAHHANPPPPPAPGSVIKAEGSRGRGHFRSDSSISFGRESDASGTSARRREERSRSREDERRSREFERPRDRERDLDRTPTDRFSLTRPRSQ